ncbi:tRNA epoxyqueuosine(34) reductase QueG [Blastomonas fulva]|jgi:epoxyqueuosine reductase|uniref:Epoxyqueuosine reductase n=1 Tax=Blastomonas fulva TaxID=1550728 RepID=A0ABM6M5G8_9SPHN|nr:tRNA epoxyqueuosine(34) reductase QueG [Blastomonas fulva]ASR51082.1 tRNA epoxyqueuosine(34) reductase QueG [Blastomonas fulva]
MVSGKKNLETDIAAEAARLGFADCAIAPASLGPQTSARLQDWLAEGCHGDMLWMEARSDQRADPATLWSDVRSVIMLGMSYAPARDPFALAEHPGLGRISVYAQGGDYHKTVKTALKALARWLVEQSDDVQVKVFVDTAPVMEKPLAMAAGLGWQGKHTNLVSREHGSWLFLGAIYTTLELAPSGASADLCGSCTACQDVCPTNAFPAPYRLDARRCISYLTIEHAGPIPAELRAGIGNHVYGCDDCLAVCPWNKFADAAHRNQAFLPRAELAAPSLADLLALDDAQFRAVFSGSPIKRSGRVRMVRNAAVAAGNSGDPALAPAVAALLDDADPVVRGAAVWALAELDPARWEAERAARIAHEQDADVQAEWRLADAPAPV